jgi:hypothetical protein
VRRGVAGFLQQARQHGGLGVKPVDHAGFDVAFDRSEVTVHKMTGGKLAGHHGGAARGADGMIDGEILEIGALRSHAIEPGSLAEGAAMDAEIAVAPIVGENEDNIGLGWCGRHEVGAPAEEKAQN